MSKRKCQHGAKFFRFDYPVTSDGIFFGNLTIEGYWCMQKREVVVDIDKVTWPANDVKDLLEIIPGMDEIDFAALQHCKGIHEGDIQGHHAKAA